MWRALRATLCEAIALAIHLKDVGVMGQPRGDEGLGPFIERQIAGDQRSPRSRRREITSNSNSAPVLNM